MPEKEKTYITPNMIPKNRRELSDEEIKNISSKKFRKHFKQSYAYNKYVQPVLDEEKYRKKKRFTKWWGDNWIAFLGLVFAFIAAIPVIIQAVEYILSNIK